MWDNLRPLQRQKGIYVSRRYVADVPIQIAMYGVAIFLLIGFLEERNITHMWYTNDVRSRCLNHSPVIESFELQIEHRNLFAYNLKNCLVIRKPGHVERDKNFSLVDLCFDFQSLFARFRNKLNWMVQAVLKKWKIFYPTFNTRTTQKSLLRMTTSFTKLSPT